MSFTIACWNLRGMNDRNKQREAQIFLLVNKLPIMAFLETKIKVDNSSRVMSIISSSGKWAHNYLFAYNGRIWLCWDDSIVDVRILFTGAQLIHCEVIWGQERFFCSFIYAYNDSNQRVELWNQLQSIRENIDIPWILMGDFNAVLLQNERFRIAGDAAVDIRELQMITGNLGL